MILSIPVLSGSPTLGMGGVWTAWVDRIVGKKEYRMTKAAIAYQETGIVAACNTEFINTQDIQNSLRAFPDSGREAPEKIVLKSHSYIVKSATENCIVAFNGTRHLIVLRSRRMCIVVMCASRRKAEDATAWLELLRQSLVSHGY